MRGEEGENGTMKLMVFFPTVKSTGFAADLVCPWSATYPLDSLIVTSLQHQFGRLSFSHPSLRFFEIHSRKSQSHRVRATREFTECKIGVLLTSDVTARGIDIPDVTAVVQVGLPSSGEQCMYFLP